MIASFKSIWRSKLETFESELDSRMFQFKWERTKSQPPVFSDGIKSGQHKTNKTCMHAHLLVDLKLNSYQMDPKFGPKVRSEPQVEDLGLTLG